VVVAAVPSAWGGGRAMAAEGDTMPLQVPALKPTPGLVVHQRRPPPAGASRAHDRRMVSAFAAVLASAAALVLLAFTVGSSGGATGATGRARPIFTAIARAYATQCMTVANPTPLCLNGEGYAKPTGGSISLSRVHGMGNLNNYNYLTVTGEDGHQIRAVLEGSDGYHKSWDGYGSVWTGPIHNRLARGDGIVDYVQVKDIQTGEIAYFRFPCGEDAATQPPLTLSSFIHQHQR